MEAKAAISELLKTIEQMERGGVQQLEVNKLGNLLRDWDRQIETHAVVTTEQRQHQLELWKIQSGAISASNLELFKSVIEAGQTALKSATVINGGAAAALLALLAEGLKAGQNSPAGGYVASLSWAWLAFMSGLGASGLATAARYLSQSNYAKSTHSIPDSQKVTAHESGNRWSRVSVFLATMSFASFIIGSLSVFAVMVIK